MARTNKSQYALLGLLSKSPMSGYDIKSLMQKMSQFYWSESNAQIYPTLKKLENEEMLTSSLDQSSGKREKRIYSITPQGKAKLMKWLKEPAEPSVYREELLLKLNLGQHVPDSEIKQWIQDHLIGLQAKQITLNAIIKHVQEDHEGRPDQPYLLMTYDFYIHQINANIRWCRESLEKLN